MSHSQSGHFCQLPLTIIPIKSGTRSAGSLSSTEKSQIFAHLQSNIKQLQSFFSSLCQTSNVQVISERECLLLEFLHLTDLKQFWSKYSDGSFSEEFNKSLQRTDFAKCTHLDTSQCQLILTLSVHDDDYREAEKCLSTAEINQSSSGQQATSGLPQSRQMPLYSHVAASGVGEKQFSASQRVSHNAQTVAGLDEYKREKLMYTNDIFSTRFQVCIPSAKNVSHVWLCLTANDSRSPPLTELYYTDGLWTLSSPIPVKKGSSYLYRVKSKEGWAIVNWFRKKITGGNNEHLFEEEYPRKVAEIPFHRDIITTMDSSVQHLQLSAGYKLFLPLMIREIHNVHDLLWIIEEYFEKHAANLSACSKHEMARFIVEDLNSLATTVRAEQAAFVVVFLSSVLPQKESWRHTQIGSENAKKLLCCLQDFPLEKNLGLYMNIAVPATLSNFLSLFVPNPSWLHFVFYCFPMLSAQTLVDMTCSFKGDCDDVHIGSGIMTKVCKALHRESEIEVLLTTVLSKVNHLCIITHSYKEIKGCSTSVQEAAERCIDTILQKNVPFSSRPNCLAILDKMACDLYSAEPELLGKFAKYFQDALLNVICKRFQINNVHSDFHSLITKPVLFCDQSNAFQLLETVAKSSEWEWHQQFPHLLSDPKFCKCTNADSVKDLIETWLMSYEHLNSSEPNVMVHYQYLKQIVDTPMLKANGEVRASVHQQVMTVFTKVAKRTVCRYQEVRHLDFLEPALKFLVQSENEQTMVSLTNDLENALCKIVRKSNGWEDKYFKKLLDIINMDNALFMNLTGILNLMDALAIATASDVNRLFLTVLQKRGSDIPSADMQKLIDRWMAGARGICTAEAKRKNKTHFVTAYIPCLYECLIAAHRLSVPKHSYLADKVSAFLKAECDRYCSELDKVLSAELNVSEDTFELMKKHIDATLTEHLPDLNSLVKFIDEHLDKLDRRFGFDQLMMYLDQVYKHFMDCGNKELFFLSHTDVWSKIHLCNAPGFRKSKLLENHMFMHSMKTTVTAFVERIERRKIKVGEFHKIKQIISGEHGDSVLKFLQHFFSSKSINILWKSVSDEVMHCKEQLQHLVMLYTRFLVPLQQECIVNICDIDTVKHELESVQQKLSESSSCALSELDSSKFLGCLSDLVPASEKLEPYSELGTFTALCKAMTDETQGESSAEVLSNFLASKCVDRYRNWLAGMAESATLEYVLQFSGSDSIETVCEEIHCAAKQLNVHITDSVRSSLNWFKGLRHHSEHIKHILRMFGVFSLPLQNTSLGEAISTFQKCLDDPDDVTLEDLNCTMESLQDILNESDVSWWAVVEELSHASELVTFLNKSSEDDFRVLIDAVEERAEQTIDESTVSDLIQVKLFLQPLLTQQFDKPDDLINDLKKLWKTRKEEKEIAGKINNCCHHVHGLKALYQHVADRGELTKEIVASALANGRYKWILDRCHTSCCVVLSCELIRKERQGKSRSDKSSFTLEELIDMKSRILLICTNDKINPNKDYESERKLKEDMQYFVNIVDKVFDIAETVNMLHCLGHFRYQTYENKLVSTVTDDVLHELNLRLKGLNSELEEWKRILNKNRNHYRSLNFLFSDQLSLLDTFLSTDGENVGLKAVEDLDSLLYFVQPGICQQHIMSCRQVIPSDSSTLTGKLKHIGEVLDQVKRDVNGLQRKTFPRNKEFLLQSNDVNAVVECGRLLIAQLDTESTQTIPVLLSLYANTMHSFPLPSEVLFCQDQTSWEEVYLLIQRCIISSPEISSTLHCIVNVEKLPNSLQYQLVKELNYLIRDETREDYYLAIICCGGTHHPIVDHFISFVRHIQGFDNATMTLCMQKTWPNVSMVTSAVPGLGKTELIFERAAHNDQSVKSVNVSGPITRYSLVSRLKTHCKLHMESVLHFDIAEVDDPAFLDAALFEFIFLGCLCCGTEIACLPTENVVFEVANSVQDRLRNSLVVLSCFQRTHLKWTGYKTTFKISNEPGSSVQIVCHYLQLLDNGTLDSVDIKIGTLKPLSAEVCQDILSRHFSVASDISFAVVEIFLEVFAYQLRKLTNSKYFTVKSLKDMLGKETAIDVRSKLVTALLEVAKEFACRSVQSCRESQASALQYCDRTENCFTLADLMANRVEGMLQWSDSNHLIVAFHNAQSLSVLYRDLKLVPIHIRNLVKSQTRKDLEDFNSMSQDSLQVILERLAKAVPTTSARSQQNQPYALTPDNLLKMVLILLRIKANVPVVIMGETGCGKTSLIRYLAATCETKFKHFNVHAGITESDIVKVIDDHDRACRLEPNKQIWLFMDEINTCNHMGLLTEIICRHSCLSKQIAQNLVILGACNPYRLREQHHITTAGLEGKVKLDEYSKLVYRVHPLPERMIDYVWDYGTLNPKDEVMYIRRMVGDIFPEYCSSLRENTVDILVSSQKFIREMESSGCCVSLRDVSRCRLLIIYFVDMLHVKHGLSGDSAVEESDFYFRAVILALGHCYVSRIAEGSRRHDYWKHCSECFLGNADSFGVLEKIIRDEQMDLLERMVIPQGIAKNTALRENVFVILVCILNHIPIFLVGKPGCSKSLSMQLIKSNLRGKDSHDEFFKRLPNLYVVSYQGSESSTSEGILKVFAKAEKYQKANKSDNVLPVVLLDEVGLAEASKFNPLKVLHSLLEPNTGELPSVAVVGISNWALDAAKMNRAVYLSRPDMDEEELYHTGVSISTVQQKDETLKLSKSPSCSKFNHSGPTLTDKTLKALAKAYFEYQGCQKVKNFHGLRDYYSLVKYVSKSMEKDKKKNEVDVIQKGLLRNFGGLTYELNEIIQHFLTAIRTTERFSWTVEEIIMDNLQDQMARHLMLITNGDSALGVLTKLLSKVDRNPIVIFGSRFEEDQTEDYSYRSLNKIILCMESGSVLVLKDLDNIYGSLYDMLNQNYTVVGRKKNCRIALGPNSNPMCQVHDEFRCIVLVDETKVNYSDPPFLNRFEKQVVRFEDIIMDSKKGLMKTLNDWMEDFSSVCGLPFRKEHAFMGVNADTVPSLVYQYSQMEPDKILDECKKALIWLMQPDAVLRASGSKLALMNRNEIDTIQKKYFELPVHERLSVILSKVDDDSIAPPVFVKTPSFRVVIYTHTNIHINLHPVLKEFEPIHIEKLGAFKSEKQLTKQLRMYFESDSRLLILQCRPSEDGQHIPLAKFLLEELQQEYAREGTLNKPICLILHMDRCGSGVGSSSWNFSYLSGWQLMTVDSLVDPCEFTLSSIINRSACDLLQTNFKPIRQCIQDRLVWSFTCTTSSYLQRSVEEFKQLIWEIVGSEHLMSFLSDYILNILRGADSVEDYESQCVASKWIMKVATDLRLLQSATSFTDALQQYLVHLVSAPLATIVYHMEKLSAWHSRFYNDGAQQELWEMMFQNVEVLHLGSVQIPQGPGSFRINHKPLNLRYPFSQCFIDKLCSHEEFFKQELVELENQDVNVDDNGELTHDVYSNLFNHYLEQFTNDLRIVTQSCDFSKHSLDFIYDVCNCLGVNHMPDELTRIQVAQWFISFKSRTHELEDSMSCVTESLLCLWRYEELFHALLQLIAECRIFLPNAIDDLLDVRQNDENKDEESFLFNETSDQGVTEKIESSVSEQTLESLSSLEPFSYEPSQEQAHGTEEALDSSHMSGTQENQNLVQTNYPFEIVCTQVHPEEQLIHLMCNFLIPSQSVFSECGTVDAWQMRVCSVLSFSGLVSGYPKMLYVLRVFNDLAMVLLHCEFDCEKIKLILCDLAQHITVTEDLELAQDVDDIFDGVLHTIEGLISENVEVVTIQHFFCMYVGRCLDINPNTHVLGKFLERITLEIHQDRTLSFVEPVIIRLFLAGEDELFNDFVEYIQDENRFNLTDHPSLAELDTTLQRVDFSKSIFHVLCVDVIQTMVFDKYPWHELSVVDSADHILIISCKRSLELVHHAASMSLRVAVAAAYLRSFFYHLSHILSHDSLQNSYSAHSFLYMNINSILDNLPDVVIVEYMVKILLSFDRSLNQVQKLFRNVDRLIPALSKFKLKENDVVMSLGYNLIRPCAVTDDEEQLKAALLDIGKDDKPLMDYLDNAYKTTDGILSFIQAVAHTTFLVRSLRQLNHAEMQIGVWLSEHGKLESPLDKFIVRLAGKDSFGIDVLQITSESGHLQIHQASFLVHLMSIVITQKSMPAFKLLWKCLSCPKDKVVVEAVSSLMLSRDRNDSFEYDAVSSKLTICRCWTRMYVMGHLEHCPLCDVEWNMKHEEQEEKALQTVAQPFCQGVLHSAHHILQILIYGALLGGYSLELYTDEDFSGIAGDDDGIDLVKNAFQCAWTSVENWLQLSTQDTGLLLHCLMDRWSSVFCSLAINDDTDVIAYLSEVSQCIASSVLTGHVQCDLRSYLNATTGASDSVRHFIYELPNGNGEMSSVSYIRQLFRQTKTRTLNDIKAQFYVTCHAGQHPVIELFLEMEPELRLVKYISHILKWTLLCNTLVTFRISREESKSLKVTKLLQSASEKASKCFNQFCEAWEEIRSEKNRTLLAKLDPVLAVLPQMHSNALVQTCIVDSTSSTVYRVLASLCSIQNRFLDVLLFATSDRRCPAVSFLKKCCSEDKSVMAVKCILMQNIKEHHLIQCDQTDMSDLTMFAHNDYQYGSGCQVHYDFIKIENEIANRLALGKVHIVLDNSFPLVTYAHELFRHSASVLCEFAALVPQEPLKPVIRSALEERHKNDADYVQLMMRQTEVLLCIAKRTGSLAEQTLSSCVHQWLRAMPGGFAEDLFPPCIEPLRLTHLVALYEFLEDLQADAAIDSLVDHFKQQMTDAVRDDLKQFADTNHVSLEAFRTALRRFVMRNVVHFDTKVNVNQPLATWMIEPSLWPQDVKEDGILTSTVDPQLQPKYLKDEFPETLILGHTFHTIKYIDFMIEDRNNKNRCVPPTPKALAAPTAVKPQARGTRAAPKTRLGRT